MSYLDKELGKASFDPVDVSHFLYGGKAQYENVKRWEKIFDEDPLFDRTYDAFLGRKELFKLANMRGAKTFKILRDNQEFRAAHSPVHGEGGLIINRFSMSHCGLSDHFILFSQTILSASSPEQLREWLPKAMTLQMIGTYCQTELGHGSNVRGLETTATYKPDTDTFVINTPTVSSTKWWPGGMGIIATHAVVYACLIVNGKNYGYHAFMVQIRDVDHNPMPGVEVGDLGPKVGQNGLDAGYMRLNNVEIPRFNMFAKFQRLEKGGKYIRAPSKLGKIAYFSMSRVRVFLTRDSANVLARSCVIALRWNAFRKQGFINSKKGVAGGERAIIDYGIQQIRLFPQLANAYAIFCASRKLYGVVLKFEASVKKAGKDVKAIDVSILPEFHSFSAGLKAIVTQMAMDGAEECRRCCGGAGYLHSSAISAQLAGPLAYITLEGDRHPMALQTAHVLFGVLMGKVPKKGTFAYLGKKDNTRIQNPENPAHVVEVWETLARNFLFRVAMAFKKAVKGRSYDDVWNEFHADLFACAHAHIMCQMVTAFTDALPEISEKARPAMTRLCLLFGLYQLSLLPVRISGINGKQGALIDAAIKQLVLQLRPDILALAEGWGYSDRVLGSLIALRTDDMYEKLLDWSKKSPLNKDQFSQQINREVFSEFLNKAYLAKGNVAPSKM